MIIMNITFFFLSWLSLIKPHKLLHGVFFIILYKWKQCMLPSLWSQWFVSHWVYVETRELLLRNYITYIYTEKQSLSRNKRKGLTYNIQILLKPFQIQTGWIHLCPRRGRIPQIRNNESGFPKLRAASWSFVSFLVKIYFQRETAPWTCKL